MCVEVFCVVVGGVFLFVFGGDYSVVIGIMVGLIFYYFNLGVIWFDVYVDLNIEECSLFGNMYGMSLVVVLGYLVFNLFYIFGVGLFINFFNLVYVGLRDIDEYEKE